MTTWYEDYVAVWDALVNLVKELKNPDLSHIFEEANVFYGERYPPDNYPSCYVCPLPIPIEPLTFLSSTNYYYFDFVIVDSNSDPKQGYLTAFGLIGKIYDALVVDHTLGGKVCNLEPQQVIPDWKGKDVGIEGFWIGLRVKFTKIRA